MAARTVGDEHLLAARHRILAEIVFEVAYQVGFAVRRLALVRACFAQVACLAFGRGQEEIEKVVQAVFNRAEVGAVTPALADVERRLAEVARLRVELAQVG